MVSLLIPAFNAEKTIEQVIGRIPETLWPQIHHIYLINDGSQDRTGTLIASLAKKNLQCIAIQQPVNSGYGASVKIGLTRCKEDACTFAVCLHADGQYPPEVIDACIKKMQTEKIDLLQGSRIASGTALSGGMPLYKYIGGRILTAMENRIFGLKLTDYHSGFLIYHRRFLDTIDLARLSSSFDIDLELIALGQAQNLVIGEYPIPTRYADERSYLAPVPYLFRVLRVMARYLSGYYHRLPVLKSEKRC